MGPGRLVFAPDSSVVLFAGAGCHSENSLMSRRRSRRSAPSCRTSSSLNCWVWSARGRVAIHDALATRASVGRWGKPSPPAATGKRANATGQL